MAEYDIKVEVTTTDYYTVEAGTKEQALALVQNGIVDPDNSFIENEEVLSVERVIDIFDDDDLDLGDEED